MTTTRLLRLQIGVLAGGTLFAWGTVASDFIRYFGAGGKLFQFTGCIYPNPLVTPCFYGAIVFLLALAWARSILRFPASEQRRNEQGLAWLLLAGTVFAWGNFGYEVYRFAQAAPGAAPSCSGVPVANPLLTPCFIGAVLYLTAFAVSLVIRRRLALVA